MQQEERLKRDDFILIASNGGAPKHPQWWFNLQANPKPLYKPVENFLRHRKTGKLRGATTPLIYGHIKVRELADYQKHTTREIPVVILIPTKNPKQSQPPSH